MIVHQDEQELLGQLRCPEMRCSRTSHVEIVRKREYSFQIVDVVSEVQIGLHLRRVDQERVHRKAVVRVSLHLPLLEHS